MTTSFGSVCSGIEAASVAWHPLGWQAAWLAEIEPFPAAVLAHHYPDVRNVGDMTTIPAMIASGELPAPDILAGGTPCQAFSIAGLRRSLDDARGNLSLTFCEIANAIDTARALRTDPAAVIFWENVPGILSTKDNAFGCFLAGLAGEDRQLLPAGGRWSNAGFVLGPSRAIAWRTLDAQYFGLAQRRRRVFVVASARADFDPLTVLFEPEGVRRDFAPSREAREGTARGVKIGPGGGRFTDLNPTLDTRAKDGPIRNQLAGCVMEPAAYAIQAGALRTNPASGPDGVGVQEGHAYTLEARAEVQAVCVTGQVTHTLRGEGFDAGEDGTGRGTPLVHAAMVSPCLRAGNQFNNSDPGMEAQMLVAFDTTQITSAANYSRPKPGDPCHPLAAGAHAPAVAFAENSRAELRLEGGDGSRCGALSTGGGKPGQGVPMVAFGVGEQPDLGNCLRSGASKADKHESTTYIQQAMQVRRLTPRECERLQGFPDDYTKIPWRKKPASECPDGPRYKALGNSWAVPVVRWIGNRIRAQLSKGTV